VGLDQADQALVHHPGKEINKLIKQEQVLHKTILYADNQSLSTQNIAIS